MTRLTKFRHVALSEGCYHTLQQIGKFGESYSDVIMRLIKESTSKDEAKLTAISATVQQQ